MESKLTIITIINNLSETHTQNIKHIKILKTKIILTVEIVFSIKYIIIMQMKNITLLKQNIIHQH